MKFIRIISLVSIVLLFAAGTGFSQTEKPKLYDPQQDVKADIKQALAQAKKDGKHVLLQIGGNW